MAISGLVRHLVRLGQQFGNPVAVGDYRFKSRGYFANRLALNADHERNLAPVIGRALAERPGPVVDVGANLGQTLAKILAVDPKREYIGFEPQVACCFFIDQFLKDNNLWNCRILPIALSDRNGIGIMRSGDSYDEMASLNGQHICTHNYKFQTFVPTRIGDEVFAELRIEGAALIKVDVEGGELQVISGLRNVLAAQRPALMFEVLPNFEGSDRTMLESAKRQENGARARSLYKFLLELNYSVYQIDQNGAELPIERFDLDDPLSYIGPDYVAHPLR